MLLGCCAFHPGGFFPEDVFSRFTATLHPALPFPDYFVAHPEHFPDERAEQQEAGDCSAQARSQGREARCHACILQPPFAVASGMWTRQDALIFTLGQVTGM